MKPQFAIYNLQSAIMRGESKPQLSLIVSQAMVLAEEAQKRILPQIAA